MHQLTLRHESFLVIADIAVDVTLQQILLLQVRQGFSLSQRRLLPFVQQRLVDTGIGREKVARGHPVQFLCLLHLIDALAEGRIILLFEPHDGLDGIDIRQTSVEVPRILMPHQFLLGHVEPIEGLLQVVVQMHMRQGEIDKGHTVALKPSPLDLLCRLQELRLGTWDITTGIIDVAHHVRDKVTSFIGILATLDVTLQSLGDMIGRRDIHPTQTVHDTAHPRRAGFQQVIVGLGMLQIGLTGIIDHLLFVLETRLPHSLLQLSVLKGILTV